MIAQQRNRLRLTRIGLNALLVKPGGGLLRQAFENDLRAFHIDRAGLWHGPAELGLEVGSQKAVGAQDARRGRDHHLADAQKLGQRAAMQRTRAAEGHKREVAGVMATLYRDHANGPDHMAVDDGENAARCLFPSKLQRFGDARPDNRRGRLDIERHAPAEQFCRQMAEHHMGIGHRRLGPAMPIGRRSRSCASALRTDGQRAIGDLRDRTAACADRHHVDHGKRQRPFADAAMLGQPDLAILDQADIGAGAADIDGDDILDAAGRGRSPRPDHAGSRPRKRRQRRRLADGLGPGDAAIRLHQQKRRFNLLVGQPLFQPFDIGGDARHDGGIQNRGQRAFELAHHRQNIGRAGNGVVRQFFTQYFDHAFLVAGIGKGVQAFLVNI